MVMGLVSGTKLGLSHADLASYCVTLTFNLLGLSFPICKMGVREVVSGAHSNLILGCSRDHFVHPIGSSPRERGVVCAEWGGVPQRCGGSSGILEGWGGWKW